MKSGFVGLSLLALCGAAAALSPAGAKLPLRAPLDDRCTKVAGYAGFRAQLTDAVKRRDAAAFDALFTPTGAMRVHSFSRFRGAGDERWGSAEVGAGVEASWMRSCGWDAASMASIVFAGDGRADRPSRD